MDDAPTDIHVRCAADCDGNATSWRIGSGEIAYGFREQGKYRIRNTVEGDRLIIDDEVLETDGGDWIWSPGFYAGQVRAELLGPGDRVRASYLLDVSPHPNKLGRDMYQAMLNQVWAFDPSLVLGTEPAASPIGHEAAISDPWLEYARMREYGDKFARALSAISRRPLRELRAERTYLPLQQVRRADRQTVLAMLGHAQLLAVLRPGHVGATTMNRLPQFDVPTVRETLDGSGNRCIAAIAHKVLRRAVQLRDKLQLIAEKEPESTTRTALASRWPRRRDFLDQLVWRFRHFQRISPLANVTRHEISAAGLNAVSADPAYSNAYGSGWRILRQGVEGPPQGERLWMSPTWEIYERWCFVQLSKTIREIEPGYDWSISRKHKSKATVAFTGSKSGCPKIELLLQPKFPAGDQGPNADFRSISGARQPDIVLTREKENTSTWHVLDAKYRTGRPNVLEAMASAHIYSDALRWKEQRPESAVLLVPQGGGARWLESPTFISQHRVGVCALTTDTDARRVVELMVAESSIH